MPTVEIIRVRGLSDAVDLARITTNKQPRNRKPSNDFLDRMIRAEHSPIRAIEVIWVWHDLPYFAHVHLVRHHVGIQPFVATQRTAEARWDRKQSHPITHANIANLQSIIDISKVRLCRRADPLTSYAWAIFLKELHTHIPVLTRYCVPTCVYRGWCPEPQTCGRMFMQLIPAYRSPERHEGGYKYSLDLIEMEIDYLKGKMEGPYEHEYR